MDKRFVGQLPDGLCVCVLVHTSNGQVVFPGGIRFRRLASGCSVCHFAGGELEILPMPSWRPCVAECKNTTNKFWSSFRPPSMNIDQHSSFGQRWPKLDNILPNLAKLGQHWPRPGHSFSMLAA